MSFPRVNAPTRRDDGQWQIRICRSPTDEEVLAYPTKAAALKGAEALRVAMRLLTPKDSRPLIADIRGPYKDAGRYMLRWTENGTNRATSGTRPELVAMRKELEGNRAADSSVRLKKRRGFGTAAWWKRSMDDALEANRLAIEAKDFEAIKASRARIDALSVASGACLPHAGHEETEAALEEANKFIAERRRQATQENAAKHAEKQGSDQGVPLADGPEDPLRRHGDPIPGQGRN